MVSKSQSRRAYPKYQASPFHDLMLIVVVIQANLIYERLSILYDIAALYSQLATSQSRTTAESLRRACQYFQQAAGTFDHLSSQTSTLRLPPGVVIDDFTEPTVATLKFLMLAQAQECFWQKAVLGTYRRVLAKKLISICIDNLKDGLIARLAAQVSDFYDQALQAGMQSINIPSDWITHITAKKLHFYSAA